MGESSANISACQDGYREQNISTLASLIEICPCGQYTLARHSNVISWRQHWLSSMICRNQWISSILCLYTYNQTNETEHTNYLAWRRKTEAAAASKCVGIVLLSLSSLVGWDQSQFPKQLSMSWSYRTAVLVIVSNEFPRCISERWLPGMVSFAFFAPDIAPSSLLGWIFCLGDACRRNMFMMNAIGGSGPHFHTERRAAPWRLSTISHQVPTCVRKCTDRYCI